MAGEKLWATTNLIVIAAAASAFAPNDVSCADVMNQTRDSNNSNFKDDDVNVLTLRLRATSGGN